MKKPLKKVALILLWILSLPLVILLSLVVVGWGLVVLFICLAWSVGFLIWLGWFIQTGEDFAHAGDDDEPGE